MDPLDLVVAMERWDLLVLLDLQDPLDLLDPLAVPLNSWHHPDRRRPLILFVVATVLMTPT